jgi:hypothetical protein
VGAFFAILMIWHLGEFACLMMSTKKLLNTTELLSIMGRSFFANKKRSPSTWDAEACHKRMTIMTTVIIHHSAARCYTVPSTSKRKLKAFYFEKTKEF